MTGELETVDAAEKEGASSGFGSTAAFVAVSLVGGVNGLKPVNVLGALVVACDLSSTDNVGGLKAGNVVGNAVGALVVSFALSFVGGMNDLKPVNALGALVAACGLFSTGADGLKPVNGLGGIAVSFAKEANGFAMTGELEAVVAAEEEGASSGFGSVAQAFVIVSFVEGVNGLRSAFLLGGLVVVCVTSSSSTGAERLRPEDGLGEPLEVDGFSLVGGVKALKPVNVLGALLLACGVSATENVGGLKAGKVVGNAIGAPVVAVLLSSVGGLKAGKVVGNAIGAPVVAFSLLSFGGTNGWNPVNATGALVVVFGLSSTENVGGLNAVNAVGVVVASDFSVGGTNGLNPVKALGALAEACDLSPTGDSDSLSPRCAKTRR